MKPVSRPLISRGLANRLCSPRLSTVGAFVSFKASSRLRPPFFELMGQLPSDLRAANGTVSGSEEDVRLEVLMAGQDLAIVPSSTVIA